MRQRSPAGTLQCATSCEISTARIPHQQWFPETLADGVARVPRRLLHDRHNHQRAVASTACDRDDMAGG